MRAADAVVSLYYRTKNKEILGYAVELGSRSVVPEIKVAMARQLYQNQLVELALLGAVESKPEIERQFVKQNSDLRMKVAAARAMVILGEKEPYFGYLFEIANRYADDDPVTGDRDLRQAGQSAMRMIGGVPGDEARTFFERALDSKNSDVVDRALINLRITYPDSEKGRERMLQELRGQPTLSAETICRLAAMTNDPAIRQAAAKRNALLWQRSALHEVKWDRGPWLRAMGISSLPK